MFLRHKPLFRKSAQGEASPSSADSPKLDSAKFARPSQEAIQAFLEELDPAEREALLHACVVAREDPVWFNALVLRNETVTGEDGRPRRISMHDCHIGLIDFMQRTQRGVVLSAPRMGKSQQGTIAYPLWTIGNDISKRVVIASSVQELAKPFIASIQQYMLESIELALIFPHLTVGKVWSALRADIRSTWMQTRRKDPSIRGMGAHGRITGGRVDLFLGDDMLDQENTRTEAESDKIYRWILNATSRMTPKTGKMLLFTNTWEEYDAAHKLIKLNGWDVYRMPAADENWKPIWEATNDEYNEGWTQEAIDLYDPVVKERHLRLRARRKDDVIFQPEWLEWCKRPHNLIYSLRGDDGIIHLPPGCAGVVGVDLASRLGERADWTVFMPLIAGPATAFGINETLPGDVTKPLWVDRRRIEGPDIIRGILELWRRYGFPFVVEDNGAQRYIAQLMKATDPEIPIITFTTDAAKKNNPEFGIRTIATEYYQRRHILPLDEDGKLPAMFQRLYEEMTLYDERVGVHTGDCLMAYWFARSYLRNAFGMRRFGIAGNPLTPADYLQAGITPSQSSVAKSQGVEKVSTSVEGEELWSKALELKANEADRTPKTRNFLNSLNDRLNRLR